ncbi:MAG TPA: tetratricopeptide repeat protein [Ktedonobacteraceae bacterium]
MNATSCLGGQTGLLNMTVGDRESTTEIQETALAAYEQAIQLAPQAAILHHHKGNVLEQMGRHREAQVAYDVARDLGYVGKSKS